MTTSSYLRISSNKCERERQRKTERETERGKKECDVVRYFYLRRLIHSLIIVPLVVFIVGITVSGPSSDGAQINHNHFHCIMTCASVT